MFQGINEFIYRTGLPSALLVLANIALIIWFLITFYRMSKNVEAIKNLLEDKKKK
ncbi:MAG TPA: hypothetical protein VJ841_05390 [Candidatus Saccharimonadales bacterium]|nr:hypothetical protein [Candidatus Saccharimonadales bacterium]